MTSWTATEGLIAVSHPAIEAVGVLLIADLIESDAFGVLHTLSLANIGICVTEIPNIAIIVVPTSTDV